MIVFLIYPSQLMDHITVAQCVHTTKLFNIKRLLCVTLTLKSTSSCWHRLRWKLSNLKPSCCWDRHQFTRTPLSNSRPTWSIDQPVIVHSCCFFFTLVSLWRVHVKWFFKWNSKHTWCFFFPMPDVCLLFAYFVDQWSLFDISTYGHSSNSCQIVWFGAHNVQCLQYGVVHLGWPSVCHPKGRRSSHTLFNQKFLLFNSVVYSVTDKTMYVMHPSPLPLNQFFILDHIMVQYYFVPYAFSINVPI